MRIAALTMSYNEPVWAAIWARHYARQVGAANCFLLDHGSDDRSADSLPINVERLSRSALDEDERAALVSARAAALLTEYDAVVHADVDELVVADPRRYRDLRAFAAERNEPVVTTVGLDLQHLAAEEAAFDPLRPIGEQRRWVRFSAAMCKPVFIRRAVRWVPGFHACEAPTCTRGLYLVHLRYADTGLGLRRLQRTREQAFARTDTNPHQRVSDQTFEDMLQMIAQLPKVAVPFDTEVGPIAAWMTRIATLRSRDEPWLSVAGNELWPLPARFLAAI